VNTAAALFRRLDWGWRLSGCPLVCDDLFEALDAILGEGRYAIFTDAVVSRIFRTFDQATAPVCMICG